jgi:hypothetical protein
VAHAWPVSHVKRQGFSMGKMKRLKVLNLQPTNTLQILLGKWRFKMVSGGFTKEKNNMQGFTWFHQYNIFFHWENEGLTNRNGDYEVANLQI